MSAPDSSSSLALAAHGIEVELGGAQVLRGVDLKVAPGELVALVGPNGAGKSTLLSVLSGDVSPSAGTIELAGRPLASYSARAAARQRAVQLQHQGLAFGFRVLDVVMMGRSPWYRTPRAAADEDVVWAAMRRTEVDVFAERAFPTLSGGEQARTSFARALAQETPVLLLDEPTAAMDIRHQEAVLSVARSLANEGTAVVVVLHDLSLAAAYADRICVLSAGTVRADGAPAEVFTAELLSDVYQHPVQVLMHEGTPVVVPVRGALAKAAPEVMEGVLG
ncbi:heme ABC transporter ATP-binding protein [Nocardioides sp. zg-536]|uniref:Heme ABC transporter ATP-binding protein n=1 Tax=Nocardioides faecalis TaxID=2803858 RepID=A0A938Y548_9ACTN|nr:heme ABC transporter ATP-binding protein [Nocardioides faecalis]MBM9459397.1 heme ABC transporter ATP-binding protein [Nocardioides faecalis]MBS4751638.1 heme ABC transporter ATP-binding protein [Nocardioides faecalis]QVI59494.1 heme ABC transporter ATP-binding protein [Nocardioides faecalis]